MKAIVRYFVRVKFFNVFSIGFFLWLILGLFFLSGKSSRIFALNGKKYNYLGARMCMACHKGALGDQYTKWKKSPHGQAYIILFNESNRMQQVRKKYNIVRPENDARCLRCHTTAKGLVPQVSTEGVGCEACHGPASGYIELSGHAIGSEPYALARKNGMWAILYTEGIALREKMCNRCHNKERLCKIEGVKVKEISLQAIAEYPFKHPLAK